jgi:hypothetical protein
MSGTAELATAIDDLGAGRPLDREQVSLIRAYLDHLDATRLDNLYGADLYLALGTNDRAFVGMFSSCRFGGGVTLPSGSVVTGQQMESVQKLDSPSGGSR